MSGVELKLSAGLSRLVLFCDLVLLQFPVRHFVGPGSQGLLRESYLIDAQRHTAAETLVDLSELLRCPQGRQAAGEIFHRLLAEVAVGVIREQRTINRSVLQAIEDLSSLLELLRSSGVIRRKQQGSDAVSNFAGCPGGVLVGEHDNSNSLIGEDYVLGGET